MSKLGSNRRFNEHNGKLVSDSRKTVGSVCRGRTTAARVEMNFWFLPGNLSFTARQAVNRFAPIDPLRVSTEHRSHLEYDHFSCASVREHRDYSVTLLIPSPLSSSQSVRSGCRTRRAGRPQFCRPRLNLETLHQTRYSADPIRCCPPDR